MRPGYSDHDAARLLPEPPKRGAPPDARTERRSPFARDRARVLHCAALRRLAGKTQVVGPGEGDVPRTRLTHSLEVAQIGRGIGEELGCDPDVVDTAGLAHDIGHPPFGHNGERALDEIAQPCGGFEGNAQTLRILTRLEPKVLGPDGGSLGLNLTRASLDAATKYPWPRRDGQPKYGVYADDLPTFTWLRAGAPGDRRCLEAQIMDWADDVAYSVHDVEDGVLSGRISLRSLTDRDERAAIAELAAAHFSPEPVAALAEAAAELVALPAVAELVARDHDGSFAAQVALKRLTSELVGRFAAAAVTGTRRSHGDGPLRRYTADLVVLPRVAAEVAVLKAMALRYVMSDPRRLAMQRTQREQLAELVAALADRAPDALDPLFHPAWHAATSDADRLRVVIDQAALLTDAQALEWHARLTGVR
ncbi:deoxyguanosinetriphosphate triphosphohydrolase [Streptoalloteichus hindustanus]|uniref:deoxyguanosinetriphosphate triphosphohydrolase n=1 Tax=Streptoalloteichus hindustanus TaxID=2017 RepID=UPI001F4348F1|nr:deoxyguanosinetriphosphate triphosphohydrolase [Streptoalloteichus hindustanus]